MRHGTLDDSIKWVSITRMKEVHIYTHTHFIHIAQCCLNNGEMAVEQRQQHHPEKGVNADVYRMPLIFM